MLPQDPVMLVSFLNLKLRDQYSNLTDLCDDMDVDREEILNKLSKAGFQYDTDLNQFK